MVPPIYKQSKKTYCHISFQRLTGSLQWQSSDSHKMSVAIFTPTPYINKWQVSLCNNLYTFHGAPRTLTWQSLSLMQCHLHNVGRQARANTLRMLMRLKKTRKEGNVLFNDVLNTFYLRLYDVGHIVQNHSDSERERKPAAAT